MRFFWGKERSNAAALEAGEVRHLLQMLADMFREAVQDLNETLSDGSLKLAISQQFATTEGQAGRQLAHNVEHSRTRQRSNRSILAARN